jgi:predicted transcriptional regulator
VKNRSRSDIISKILVSARGDWVIKTRMTEEASLSFDQLRGYLSMMVERDLLEVIQDQALYRTTEKGLKYLDAYKQMHALAGDLRQITA